MKKTLIILVFTLSNVAIAAAQQLTPTVQTPAGSSGPTKIALVENLPRAEWPVIVSGIVQIILGITGSLAFIAFTVGGVMFITAQGSEDRLTKAKSIIYWSIAALLVIAASYALVLGVTQLQFF